MEKEVSGSVQGDGAESSRDEEKGVVRDKTRIHHLDVMICMGMQHIRSSVSRLVMALNQGPYGLRMTGWLSQSSQNRRLIGAYHQFDSIQHQQYHNIGRELQQL